MPAERLGTLLVPVAGLSGTTYPPGTTVSVRGRGATVDAFVKGTGCRCRGGSSPTDSARTSPTADAAGSHPATVPGAPRDTAGGGPALGAGGRAGTRPGRPAFCRAVDQPRGRMHHGECRAPAAERVGRVVGA